MTKSQGLDAQANKTEEVNQKTDTNATKSEDSSANTTKTTDD